ncbi:glutathione S-transferase [Xylaria cf. heliscus]|nr:glutathione S-transferase [Xylaria cf. heliscus]
MASPSDLPIVLYHYKLSPFARRIVWYLNLRKIPYSECIQPRIMPRPDLNLLGVTYRRIPVLSIGRDVYLDTRLILQKLEALYPASAAHPGISSGSEGVNPGHAAALTQLISARTIDGLLFKNFVQSLPAGTFSDPALLRDRAALNGIDVDRPGALTPPPPETRSRVRAEALAVVRRWVRWLEEGLLADGRAWILDSNAGGAGAGPSLADLEAVWVLHWVSGIPGALPAEILSAESAPKVSAWIKRFSGAVKEAARTAPATPSLKGEEAAKVIVGALFAEPEGEVRREDPVVDALGLLKGGAVKVWPTDYGSSHKDAGKLVAVDDNEFVIEAEGDFGSVRIHAPRHGFTISKNDDSVSPKI